MTLHRCPCCRAKSGVPKAVYSEATARHVAAERTALDEATDAYPCPHGMGWHVGRIGIRRRRDQPRQEQTQGAMR